MQIRKVSMKHQSGTKEYHLVLIATGAVQICFQRWGKAGSWGQLAIVTENAGVEFGKKIREKQGRGYNTTLDRTDSAISEEEFRVKIGPGYLAHMKDVYLTLFPGSSFDVSALKSARPTEFTKEGDRYVPVEDPRRLIVESEEDKIAQKVAQNPNWGSW